MSPPALSSAGLARAFGAAAPLCRRGISALLAALAHAATDGSGRRGTASAALGAWRERYGAVCGFDLDAPSPRARTLATALAQPEDTPPALLLFAVHSYYALLLQLLCADVLAHSRGVPSPVAPLRAARGDGVDNDERRLLRDLASGAVFRALGVANLQDDDIFTWYASAPTPALTELCRDLAARLLTLPPASLAPGRGADLLKGLYQALFPRRVRHGLGEYYTPDWLAEHVLDQLGYHGDPALRLLDPACGSGTFLVAALNRARAAHAGEPGLLRRLLTHIVGFDLNPLAVLAARVNYLITVRDLLGDDAIAEPLHIPVYLCDSILTPFGAAQLLAPSWAELGPLFQRAAQPPPLPPFDLIAGNPPWVLWDHLPASYRAATRPLWEHYGLFTLSGKDARHGGGKKDLAALMLYACADAYLRDGGRLGFVITQTLFQTRGAGEGFRRLRLGPEGAPLRVLRVDDLVALQPFPGANNWTSTLVLEKGQPTAYPLPYYRWTPSRTSAKGAPEIQRLLATPSLPDDPRSPWLLQPEALSGGGDHPALVGPAGRGAYSAHAGAYSGGQNAVYWVQVLDGCAATGLARVRNLSATSKTTVPQVEREIEAALLYPLLRWGDVRPFCARPSAHLLLVQDLLTRRGIPESVMAERYPRALSYLREFQGPLRARAAFRRYFRPESDVAFYTMYDIGAYTLAPWKVVWRRMDRRLGAAVVGPLSDARLPWLQARPVVPQETCVLIAVAGEEEAHYVCGLLNSAVLGYLLQGQSVRGGKSFGTPGMLAQVRLPSFEAGDALHRDIAALARAEHQRRQDPAPREAAGAERPGLLDDRVAALYGVTTTSLRLMQEAAR